MLEDAAGQSFYNTSKHTFTTLLADPDNVAGNLRNYIAGFSESARDIIDKFNFDTQIDRLAEHNLLYLVVSKFADLDLRPDNVSNLEMGYIYEELIRRFSELSNETAGEHFTPREVIRLMVNLLFVDDDELLTKPGIVKTMLDPACGTGGMLSVSEDYLRQLNPQGSLHVYGQEVNAETYATCRADMLIKGQDASRIRFGKQLRQTTSTRNAVSTTCWPTHPSASSGRWSPTPSSPSTRLWAWPGGSVPALHASTTAASCSFST